MPATALLHFTEDIARARAIVAHTDPLPRVTPDEKLLCSDLLRSAWMFAVGGLDAYFCDAYTDIIAATASSKSRQPAITLPEWVYEVRFPLRAILESYDNENWRWRMAARKMMERENVMSLKAVQDLFNKFFRKGHRFFRDQLDCWSPGRMQRSGSLASHKRTISRSPRRISTLHEMPQSTSWRSGSARSSNGGTTASTTATALGCRRSRSKGAARS